MFADIGVLYIDLMTSFVVCAPVLVFCNVFTAETKSEEFGTARFSVFPILLFSSIKNYICKC